MRKNQIYKYMINNRIKKMNEQLNTLIEDYLYTIERFKIHNIPENLYIKKPYMEEYMIGLSKFYRIEIIKVKIVEKIEDEEISKEDISTLLSFLYPFTKEDKVLIQKYLFEKVTFEKVEESSFIFSLFILQIKYFQFYMLMIDLFYNRQHHTQLSDDIYLWIENNESKMKKYFRSCQKDKKTYEISSFVVFYNLLNELFLHYEKTLELLQNELNVIFQFSKKNRYLFIQLIFSPWYENIYKKQKENNNKNENENEKKENESNIKKSLFSRFRREKDKK